MNQPFAEKSASSGDADAGERWYRELAGASPEAVAICREGRMVYANRAAAALMGAAAPSALVGLSVLRLVAAACRRTLADYLRAVAAGRAPHPLRELALRRFNGERREVELTLLPTVWEGAPALQVIARDVTERQQVAAQMLEVDRLATVGVAAAGMGHEINNALAYVTANISFARDEVHRARTQLGTAAGAAGAVGRALAEVEQALGDAREGSERIRGIVLDLRAFSRAEGDQRPVDVTRMLETAIGMAFSEVRQRARLVRNLGPVAPVHGHEARLGQVFLNLLVNAAQAIAPGAADQNTIRVWTAMRGDRVVVGIRDTGGGIPGAVRARIFDPFFTTKPPGQGTGLGLAVCARIVRDHDGVIEVESEEGLGTEVRVVLPASPEAQAGPRAAFTPARPVPAVPSPLRRGRILVVDDEELVGATVRRALQREHDVSVITSARRALDLLAAGETFDLIFCDLLMPDMTGMDFFDALPRVQPEAAPRVVFLTGGVYAPTVRAFLDRVPNPTVIKPFSPAEIRAHVRRRVA